MRKLALYWRLLGNVLQNPRYHFFVIRRNWYGRVAKQLARGEPPSEGTFYPTKLDLRIVYGCNLRCKMCGQWGDTGSYFNFDALKKQRRLEPQIIESVVKELVPHGLRFVDIEGGETFLYPNIIELFRMLKSYGLFVKPVTNGTLLKKYAKDLVESGVDAVHVSIDGDREFHNHVRQATWAYDRTLEGLAAVIDERRRAGRHTPLVVVNFTLTRHNGAIGLRKLCEELAGKGLLDVLSVKASPIWMPEKQGEEYDRLVERYFGARGLTSWRGFVEEYGDFVDGAKEAAGAIKQLKRANHDFFVAALPSIDLQQLPRMYADYKWNLGRTHCPIPYVEPTIDADGNVFPCNLFTDEPISMGNIYEKPFLEIWFGERYRTFRRMLAEQGGLLPICNRCCQLTEH